eukprot:356118_1
MASPVLNNTIESPTMGTEEKQDLHLKALPIDELLPHHVIQYMIGFNGDLRHIELVNKTFHKCSKSSQRLLLQQTVTVWQNEFNDLHSDLGNNRIINVYPSMRCNTLPLAIQHAQSGDTLIIHEGTYVFQQDYRMDKNIKFIGHGSNVIIKVSASDEEPQRIVDFSFIAKYTYIRNITFDIGNVSEWFVGNGCSFYMENCFIGFNCQTMHILGAETMKIKHCVIKGGALNEGGFYFDGGLPSIMEIESCVFENCCCWGLKYDHCIILHPDKNTKSTIAKFRFVGNHFKNNFGLPIVNTSEPCELIIEDTQILNNTWCYNNRDFVPRWVPSFRDLNANKIYQHIEIKQQHQN